MLFTFQQSTHLSICREIGRKYIKLREIIFSNQHCHIICVEPDATSGQSRVYLSWGWRDRISSAQNISEFCRVQCTNNLPPNHQKGVFSGVAAQVRPFEELWSANTSSKTARPKKNYLQHLSKTRSRGRVTKGKSKRLKGGL